jgi:FkbM family methyltransferase
VLICNQYGISPAEAGGKLVADVGANIGLFSILAAYNGAKEVYAFEPVRETFEILQKNVQVNGLGNVIRPINKAIGEKNYATEISYGYAGDSCAHIDSNEGEGKKETIQVVTLDDALAGKKLGLMKIDTEGYEKNVLLGAKNLLATLKPVIYMSAYHKPEDKTELPQTLLSIRPDYQITLKKHYEEDFDCR